MDPNTAYKQGYLKLVEKLGRPPTTTELLPLHNEYARAWGPAEETLVAPRRAIPAASEPLSGLDKSSPAPEAESPPEPPRVNPRPAEGLIVGRRGPGGGVVAACVQCHAPFERPATRGRPPARCVSCRG